MPIVPVLVQKELQNAYIWEYPGATVQTFDFQNDWSLNWTGITIYWTPNYVSWEWWSIGHSSSSYQSAIMPPSSVYNGETLKKWKLRVYKSNATVGDRGAWWWLSARSHSNWLVCCHQAHIGDGYWANVYDGSSDHFTEVVEFIWEATLEYNLNDDWTLTLSINWWTEYNLWNFSTQFRNNWSNNNLWICIGRWTYSWTFYIRKIEITTA